MQFIWYFVTEVVAMVYCRNWSRKVGDCGNTWVAVSVSSQYLDLWVRFWLLTGLGTGLATITYLPWSIPIISQGLQTFFDKFSALNEDLNWAVVVTFWMVQQSEHYLTIGFPIVRSMWRSHCWGRSLFTIITSCPNNGNVSHAHASNNSKSYCSDCCTIQNAATMCSCWVKFRSSFKTKNLHKNIFVSYFYFKPS